MLSRADGEQILDGSARGDSWVVSPIEDMDVDVVGRWEAGEDPGDELGAALR